MATYNRGVYVEELPTSILPPVRTGTIIFAVGTTSTGPVNEPRLIFTYDEYVNTFGHNGDYSRYTLDEVADIAFKYEKIAPVIFVNVFNPAVHLDANGNPDPTVVSSTDVIGGIDTTTGRKTGLELVDEVYPRFRILPSIIIAPKFSADPSVATAINAKATLVNGHFKAMGYVDVDVNLYTDAPAYLVNNGLKYPHLKTFYGKGLLGEQFVNPSTLAACKKARIDAENSNIPNQTVSNKPLPINDASVHLGLDEANYLAGQGVVPLYNNANGWVFWGTRTSAYPALTDPKDTFDNIRHMFNWLANEFILTLNQKVDSNITRRLIDTILQSYQIRLDGLSAGEYILGGRIEFIEDSNPLTDLLDGIIRFNLYFTPPTPAKEIVGLIEYDPSYFQTLFK